MGRPWVIGIRDPDDKDKVVTRIPIVNSAMSTSGDYERFFDEGGVRYHHIIDPRTGHSASKVRSATILGPTATETDGMSKTAFVLGPEKALEIICNGDVTARAFVNREEPLSELLEVMQHLMSHNGHLKTAILP